MVKFLLQFNADVNILTKVKLRRRPNIPKTTLYIKIAYHVNIHQHFDHASCVVEYKQNNVYSSFFFAFKHQISKHIHIESKCKPASNISVLCVTCVCCLRVGFGFATKKCFRASVFTVRICTQTHTQKQTNKQTKIPNLTNYSCHSHCRHCASVSVFFVMFLLFL